MEIVKRLVNSSDSEIILKWRNSTSARKVSQTSVALSESEHKEWFESRINRLKAEPFWIMSMGQKDVGFVRLDLWGASGDTFAVSIFVEPEFRSVGIGRQMLSIALKSIDLAQDEYHILAVIGRDNKGSLKLFKSFGFKLFMRIDDRFDQYKMSASRKGFGAPSIQS